MVNRINKDAKRMLDLSIKSLDHIMQVAAEKEDLETMVAVSDRLMLLYQHLAEHHPMKIKPGFSILGNEESDLEDGE